nr:hypothetical protein BaRGS_015549 [Batillaria attramentaria]
MSIFRLVAATRAWQRLAKKKRAETPEVKYENTYRLEPDDKSKFSATKVERILRETSGMMNTSLAPEDEFVGTEVEPWARVMFGFLFTVCSVNGVVGCMLISATLWTDKEFRTSSNTYTIYMTSLVITDLYNQAYFFPLIAIDFIIGRYPVVNHAQCVMTAYLIGACYIVFLLTLVAISFDRYLKVCHDVIYRKYISRRTSLIVCMVLWSIGLLSESSSVIMGTLKFERRAHCCLGDLDRTNNPFITMIYVLEAIVVIGLGFPNIMIYRTYRQTRQRVKHWGGGGGQKVTVAPSQVTTSVGPQDSDHLQVKVKPVLHPVRFKAKVKAKMTRKIKRSVTAVP